MTGIRTVVAMGVTGGLCAALLGTVPASAAPQPEAVLAGGAAINKGKAPCTSVPNLAGKKPGQLLAYKKVSTDKSLIKNAVMYRVLYTTTGVDEKSVQASCGLVLMPKKPAKRTNQVVAWAHGTIGLHQSCQPSNDPNAFLKLGIVQYGQGSDRVEGTAQQGILQTFINRGQMLTATDYYSGMGLPASAQQNYIVGVPSGAAVLDSVRSGIALAAKLKGTAKRVKTYRMAVWGASQGGHAALWAGQLAEDYLSATKLPKQPTIDQVGVVATVPAASFVATANTPPDLVGRHLADLEMHEPAVIFGQPSAVWGPLLFSLVMTSWDKYSAQGQPTGAAQFPGSPAGTPVAMADVMTPEGIDTANTISSGCLGLSTATATTKYLKPAENAFFQEPIWGGPTGPGGQWQGQLDATCLNPATPQAQQNWCTWLAYNQPGPDGINPFSKYPLRANGKKAPVLIAEGMADETIYCQSPGTDLPSPADCMARQLYDSMTPACAATSVQLKLYAKTATSPASHISTTFQLADGGKGRYKGSPMDTFLKGAFAKKLKTGCSATVVNR